ncbi:MAG: right-handed parallel beta-helix repeat-containing protein, partial [Thermoguttaceae bacterium]|nr:right-handed parallel beta-helix repeat-containing protein [Thermoguttaceae bacterium]
VEKCRFTDSKKGGGIFVLDGASGTFTDCEASGNAYSGIEVRDSGTNPTVEKCRSTNNQEAGIGVCDGASGTFTDCEASGNAYSGIQVEGSGTNPTVEKCRSTNNQNAGIAVLLGASGTFRNNTLSENGSWFFRSNWYVEDGSSPVRIGNTPNE